MSSEKPLTEIVKVVVRCRDCSRREIENGCERIVDVFKDKGLIEVRKPELTSDPPKSFTFDSVYDWNSKQRELYDETFHDFVESAIEGYNVTIFAYGQTTMGKTHTMQGVKDDPELSGVMQRAFEHIFQHVAQSKNQKYLIRASYIDIYKEQITDLLSKDYHNKLMIKERPDSGVYIKDLSYFVTSSIKELEHVLHTGNTSRLIGQTNMGQVSSRSATIFTINIECQDVLEEAGNSSVRIGRLSFVDLAGSERASRTSPEGARLREATKISLSLSPLKNVIMALTDEKSHFVPYRDSKVTRLTQDALGGKGKTIFVGHIGTASQHYDETISTLRYCNRAKNIKNKPKIYYEAKDSLLQEFQDEIARLKADVEVLEIQREIDRNQNEDGEITYQSDHGCDQDIQSKQMKNEEKEKLQQKAKDEEEVLKYEEELLYGKIKTMESRILTGKHV